MTRYSESQRFAAAMLAQGSRLGILAPRSDDELARLDRIADGCRDRDGVCPAEYDPRPYGPSLRPKRPAPAPSEPLWMAEAFDHDADHPDDLERCQP